MKTPAKTKAAAIGSAAAQAKAHRKFIMCARYIMRYMPEPCISPRGITCKDYEFPAQPGLTKGKKLRAHDRIMLTMTIVTRNGNRTNSWQQYAYPQSFLKAIRGYLPEEVIPNIDWSNFCDRAGSSEDLKPVVAEFEDFVDEYMNKIETLLAASYLESGDKSGKQYLEVLSRKFRSEWNTSPATVRFNAKAEVPSSSEDTEDQKTTTVTFNFETVMPDENDKP
jgi:hypothetical protein